MSDVYSHEYTNKELKSSSRHDKKKKLAMSKYMSEFETALLTCTEPIHVGDTQGAEVEVEVFGQRGVLVNKHELANWQGSVPISHYPLNQDLKPKLIIKKSRQNVEYTQELAIRYLRPPTPPPPMMRRRNNDERHTALTRVMQANTRIRKNLH